MNPILRNTLGFVLAWIIGSMCNLATLFIGMKLIPMPEGVEFDKIMDPNSNALADAISKFDFIHFMIPFSAHAIGTLVGAFLITKFAASQWRNLSLLMGAFFMTGGILMIIDLPDSPTWFNIMDLALAYFPMCLLGWKLAGAKV